MNETGHTPGPWHIGKRGVSVGHGKETIAFVFGNMDERHVANTKLIAAAPDLLEACKAFVSLWEDKEANQDTAMLSCQMALAAIAKAERKDT